MNHHPDRASGDAENFYKHALQVLKESRIEFLVCGAYALEAYTGISRRTKDLDVFVRGADCRRALDALSRAGYATEIAFTHWLGKAFSGEALLDVIYSSGNGLCPVDNTWFAHAVDYEVLGERVQLCPPEEMIWQKSFIMERERFDGADVAHLLRALGKELDWLRLLGRFGEHWPVLYAHLLLFRYIYPSHQEVIPSEVLRDLASRVPLNTNHTDESQALCRGTVLSREQYLVDVGCWGYADARLAPHGRMTQAEIGRWTHPILQEASPACQERCGVK